MSIPTVAFKNRSLGADIYVQVPAGLDNLVLANTPEDVFNGAVKHTFHQKWNPAFRKSLVELLAAHTGFAVPSTGKQKKNRKGDTIDILITEADYINLLKAGYGEADEAGKKPTLDEADYLVLCQQAADKTPFELAKAEEDAAPDPVFYSTAKRILAMVEAGSVGPSGQPVTEEGFIAKWTAANPGHNFDNLGGFTEDGIARALEIDDKRRKMALPEGLV